MQFHSSTFLIGARQYDAYWWYHQSAIDTVWACEYSRPLKRMQLTCNAWVGVPLMSRWRSLGENLQTLSKTSGCVTAWLSFHWSHLLGVSSVTGLKTNLCMSLTTWNILECNCSTSRAKKHFCEQLEKIYLCCLKRPINSLLIWAILLCGVVSDGKTE